MEKAKKVYINQEGAESRSATPETVAVVFQFANGEVRKVAPGDFKPEIQACFMLNGISQKLGDKYAGSDSVEEAVEAFDDLLSGLQEGRWLQRAAEAGPRTTDLALALVAVLPDKYTSVEQAAAAIAEWTEEKRKGAVKIPQIKAEIDAIRAKRQAEKAAKSKETAKAADSATLADL